MPTTITGSTGVSKVQDGVIETADFAVGQLPISATTANVLAATAGASYGAVGTYVAAHTTGANLSQGAIIAGSDLRGADPNNATINANLSGTWRAMTGSTRTSYQIGGLGHLFLRIS
jgi:hypothetical protein